MTRFAVIVACLSGCGLALDLDPPDPDVGRGDAGAPTDAGATAGDVGPAADGATPDAGPPPTECGGIDGLIETFDAEPAVPSWGSLTPFANPDSFVHDPSGALRIRAVPGLEHGVLSRFGYRFTRSEIAIRVTSVPAPESPDVAVFGILLDETRSLGFACDGEILGAFEGPVAIGSVRYDPAAHRWWRIRDAGGTVIFEARGDADGSWSPIASTPLPPWTDHAFVGAGMQGGSMPTAVIGDFVIDGINTHPENEAEPLCDIETFRDSYGDVTLGDAWAAVQLLPECAFDVGGGRLSLAVGASTGFGSLCVMRTTHAYRMTETGVFVELDPDWFPDRDHFQAVWAVQDLHGRIAYVTCDGTTLYFVPPDGTPTVSVGVCPAATIWSLTRAGESLRFTARDRATGFMAIDFTTPSHGLDLDALGVGFGWYSSPRKAPYAQHVLGYNVVTR